MTLLSRKKLFLNVLDVISITGGCFSLLASTVLSERTQTMQNADASPTFSKKSV